MLIPYDGFLHYQELEEGEVLARFDRLMARMAERHAGADQEEVAADVAAVRAELES